jgi:glycine/D-amino acid oxidase-like deaminating enzyme
MEHADLIVVGAGVLGTFHAFKQAVDGSLIVGDSHEYRDAQQADALGFDIRSDVSNLILHEAKKILTLPSWDIQRTWAGFYAQCKVQDILIREVEPDIHIVTAIGGKGMTGSPGFARAHIHALFDSAASALMAG